MKINKKRAKTLAAEFAFFCLEERLCDFTAWLERHGVTPEEQPVSHSNAMGGFGALCRSVADMAGFADDVIGASDYYRTKRSIWEDSVS